MADTKISADAAASALADADIFPVVQGGANKKATAAQIKTHASSTSLPITPREQTVISAATVTPTADNDIVTITAQAAALTLANPSGSPVQGQGMVIRIKDNATARAISYGNQYRAIGVTLPTTTVIGKTTYLSMIYNATDTKWDVLAVGQEA